MKLEVIAALDLFTSHLLLFLESGVTSEVWNDEWTQSRVFHYIWLFTSKITTDLKAFVSDLISSDPSFKHEDKQNSTHKKTEKKIPTFTSPFPLLLLHMGDITKSKQKQVRKTITSAKIALKSRSKFPYFIYNNN